MRSPYPMVGSQRPAARPGFDQAKYPTAAHGAAYDPDHAYTFGLQRVIDGLGALIDARAT